MESAQGEEERRRRKEEKKKRKLERRAKRKEEEAKAAQGESADGRQPRREEGKGVPEPRHQQPLTSPPKAVKRKHDGDTSASPAGARPLSRAPRPAPALPQQKKHKGGGGGGGGGDGSARADPSRWNFEVDYNDHFETPLQAYEDLQPFLLALSASLGKKPSDLAIYDPYFCQGNMRGFLAQLGFTTVINDNVDFYAEIAAGRIAPYDVLVTNPPYSGDHKQRLLDFLSRPTGGTKPFALLLPSYTATKSYWRDFTLRKRAHGLAKSELYLMPPNSYEYMHPEGTGKDAPPFYSCWFLGDFVADGGEKLKASLTAPRHKSSNSGAQQRKKPQQQTKGPRVCKVLESIDALVENGYAKEKRMNPKRRKRLMKQGLKA